MNIGIPTPRLRTNSTSWKWKEYVVPLRLTVPAARQLEHLIQTQATTRTWLLGKPVSGIDVAVKPPLTSSRTSVKGRE